ncbi:unnamed protein product [Prorocentrum cordatum]|uniref:Uncharacterized protein n=1 Tax=Prorocentrum cordatum TaxID=2364126 RepID=A0ABN9RGB2_9DINO|nr:unnamed protein product [Polarella glacialis]
MVDELLQIGGHSRSVGHDSQPGTAATFGAKSKHEQPQHEQGIACMSARVLLRDGGEERVTSREEGPHAGSAGMGEGRLCSGEGDKDRDIEVEEKMHCAKSRVKAGVAPE